MLSSALGAIGESGIRSWLRLFGRKVSRAENPWLDNPAGPRGKIGAAFYESIAAAEKLELRRATAGEGLLSDFEALRGPDFGPEKVDRRIRDFYEHSSVYQLDAWSETSLFTRVFLWFLVTFVSRRIDQLNFPTSSMDTSRGMTSDVIQMIDPKSGRVVEESCGERARHIRRVLLNRTARRASRPLRAGQLSTAAGKLDGLPSP